MRAAALTVAFAVLAAYLASRSFDVPAQFSFWIDKQGGQAATLSTSVGTLWVVAHWRIAAFLEDLDGRWEPPGFLEPVETTFIVVVGAVASLLLVTGVQALFRKGIARRLRGVPPRQPTNSRDPEERSPAPRRLG